MLCVEVSPTVSSQYLWASRTSSGSLPRGKVTFHFPTARGSFRGPGCQGPQPLLLPRAKCKCSCTYCFFVFVSVMVSSLVFVHEVLFGTVCSIWYLLKPWSQTVPDWHSSLLIFFLRRRQVCKTGWGNREDICWKEVGTALNSAVPNSHW